MEPGFMNLLLERFEECGHVSTNSRDIASFVSASRKVIFFALRGDTFDGNRFAASALEAGASYVVVDDPAVVPRDDGRYMLVDDALFALQQLAWTWRSSIPTRVLAITGSNGKTTTKELVSRVLACRYRVHTSRGNQNNHIGVPLTLLRMPRDTEMAVIEMGANHRGEIARLCEIAMPHYGIVTNIGRAHLEGFGGEDGIRKGKGELYDYLVRNEGIAFYNADLPALCGMTTERPELRAVPYTMAGIQSGYTFGGVLDIRYAGCEPPIRSSLVGDYNRYNVMAAICIGLYFGIPFSSIAAAISSFVPDNNRSQLVDTAHNRLIVDVYNANPSNMQHALDNFLRDEIPDKTVILGDMKELGEYAPREHRVVFERLAGRNDIQVWLVGPEYEAFRDEKGADRMLFFPDAAACALYLQEHPLAGRNILVKGSRSIGMERVLPYL